MGVFYLLSSGPYETHGDPRSVVTGIRRALGIPAGAQPYSKFAAAFYGDWESTEQTVVAALRAINHVEIPLRRIPGFEVKPHHPIEADSKLHLKHKLQHAMVGLLNRYAGSRTDGESVPTLIAGYPWPYIDLAPDNAIPSADGFGDIVACFVSRGPQKRCYFFGDYIPLTHGG